MESAWSRMVPQMRFDLPEWNRRLIPHGIRLVEAQPIPEGKANTNLRGVTAEGDVVLLRLYQRNPRAGALEAALAARLSEEPFVARLRLFDESAGIALYEFKAGASLESLVVAGRAAEVVAAAASIGQAAARIHRIRFSAAGFLGPDLRVVDFWESPGSGIAGHVEHLLGRPRVVARLGWKEVRRIRTFSAILSAQIDAFDPVPVLSHGDFKGSNLLIHDGRLSAVVDWEFAHAGTPLLALGQLFRHPLPAGFEAAFAEGYGEAGGRLAGDWRSLARRTDLVNLLDFLDRPGCGESEQQDLLGLIRQTD